MNYLAYNELGHTVVETGVALCETAFFAIDPENCSIVQQVLIDFSITRESGTRRNTDRTAVEKYTQD